LIIVARETPVTIGTITRIYAAHLSADASLWDVTGKLGNLTGLY
jgi:hypothetical protein